MFLAIALIIIAGVIAWVLRPGQKWTGPRRIAILATLIPPTVVAIAAVIFQLLNNAAGRVEVSGISNTLFILGLCLIGVAILVLAVFAVKRNSEVVRGMGFGICISVIVYTLEFGLLEWLAGM